SVAREVPWITAEGGADVPAGASERGQPDHRHPVRKRLASCAAGHVQGEGPLRTQPRAEGGRGIRRTPGFDPRAAAGGGTGGRDRRDGGVEPGSEPARAPDGPL